MPTPRTDALAGVPMTRHDSDEFARVLENDLNTARELHAGAISLLNEETLRLAQAQETIAAFVKRDTEITAKLGSETAHLDYLEKLIRHCPHAEFDFSEDPDEDKPQGFSIAVDGCDPSLAVGATLREAIAADRKNHEVSTA